MAIIIKLQDIDEAIENLRYKAETTLKSKLLRALRHYYQDEDSAESLESIDTEELVKTVWETGDDAALLKTKRKNFSSLKSSVNSDLKKLYAEGKNPLGIVIGHTNVFSISDEAKDKALSGIMDVFKDKGIDTQSKISEILSALSDILSSSAIDTEVENTKEEIERLKDVLGGISGKLGLSLQDIIRRGDDKGGRRGRTEEKTEKTLEDTEKVGDITDYLKGGLSMIDQALQGLAHEIEEASIVPSKKDMVDSVRTAIEDIVSVLKESKTDAAGEAQKIIVSAEKIIAGIAEDPATGLSSVQAEKIRQVLQEIAAAAEQGKLPEDGTATPAHKAGIELLAKVSDILGKAGMTADEKISKIMALVRLIADGALADAQVAASQEEQAQFIEKIDHIAQNIEELIRKSLHKAKTPESAEDVWRSSFSDISQALQDVETGTEDKAGKILEIVESTLDRMLEAPQSGLPDEQGEKLRQMIRQMTRTSAGPVDRIGPEDVGEEGKEAPEETVMTEKEEVRESLPGAAESVEGKGDAGTAVTEPAEAAEVKTGAKPEAEHQQLLQQAMQTTLADLLTAIQDSDTDAASKAKKIMAAVSELVGDALQKESGGEGGTDQERIREMLNKITDGLEALTELEVVEDLAGEGEMETIEIVEEVAPESLQEAAGIPVGEGGEYEIVEEIVGEGEGAGVGAEAEAGAGVGGEEGVSGAEGEGGEYEIVEEIVGEGEGAGVGAEGEAGSGVGGEEGVAGAEGEGGEYEIVEEIVGEGEGAGVGAEGEAGSGVGGEEGIAGAEGEGGEYEIVEEIVGEGEGAGVGAEAEAGAGVGGEEGVSGAEGEGGEYEIVEEIVGEGEGAGVGAEGEAGAGVGGEEGVAGAEGEGGEYEIVEEIVGEGEGSGVGAEAGAGVGGEEGAVGAEGELIQEVTGAAAGEGGEYEIVEEIVGEGEGSGVGAEAGAGVGGEEGAAGAEGELIHEVAEVPAGEGGEYEIVEEIVGEGEGSGVGAEAGAGVGVGGEEGAAGAEGELIHEVAEVPAGEGGEYEIVEEIVGEGEGAGVGAEAEVGAGVGGEEGVAGAEGEGGEYEIVEEIVGEGEGAGVGAEAEAGAGVGGEEGVAGAAGEGGEYEIVEEIVGEGEGAGIGAEAEAGIGGEEGGAGAAGEGGEYEIVEEIVGEGEGAGIGAEAEAGIGGEEGGAGAAGEGGEYEIVEEIVGEGEGDGVGAEAEAGAGIGGEEGVTGAAGEGGEYEIVEEIVGEGEGAGVGGEEGAAVAEGELIQEVAAAGREESIRETISHIENVLQDSGLNAADKISKILSAVNEMVGEALSTGGLGQDGEDLARLRDLMNNIKDNLDVFSREDISGLEVIEEIVDEGARAVEEAEGEEIAETTGAGLEAVPGVGEGGLVWGEPGVEGAGGESLEELEAAEGVGQEEKEAGPEEPELEEEIIEEEGEGEGSEISGFPEEVQEAQMEAVGGQEPADHGVAEGVLGQPDEGQETKGPEIIEEEGEGEAGGSSITVIASDGVVDGDLREKTDLLTRLAEAASVLQGLGPDLNSSVYTEEQIRGNARFLSEEFDRYLSMRDKYYNSHVLVQGGDYLVGGAHLAKSVLEEQIVVLQDYYIGKFPVTNAVFEIFVEQTGYITMAEKYGFSLVYYPRMQRSRDPLTGAERFSLHSQAYSKKVPGACWHKPFGPDSSLHMKRSHPVVHVSFDDAQAFAAWTGKRLPTEIEWEAAARTPRGLVYPWGNQWQEGSCNIEQSLHGDTTSVDRYIKHANAAEVADMLGNVLEWTCDVIGDQETSDMHIVKGASWISSSEISLIDRHYIEKTTASNILGFRCVAI